MAISTSDLVDKVTALSKSSEQLSSEIACASQDLKRDANHLSMLTRGSRSGEESTNVVRESAQTLANIAKVISLVCGSCDDYIRNAVR
ncbi:MAG: hypothetical protein LBM13_01070 [Candidatus Ancillula sp.]|jgi:hypothetical protein|nr:hypothetical protein [Candidatus Ancillula sp.]